jgi:hypothetical protein
LKTQTTPQVVTATPGAFSAPTAHAIASIATIASIAPIAPIAPIACYQMKKHGFFFAHRSLIRNFGLRSKLLPFGQANEKTQVFSLPTAHLFVTLQVIFWKTIIKQQYGLSISRD